MLSKKPSETLSPAYSLEPTVRKGSLVVEVDLEDFIVLKTEFGSEVKT